MPAWLVTLLMALVKSVVGVLKVTKRELAFVLFTLLLCGVGATMLAQSVVVPFLGRVDSMQTQIDSLRSVDALLQRADSQLTEEIAHIAKSTGTNLLFQCLDSPLLTLEEKAQIATLMSYGEMVNADSVARLIMVRKTAKMLGQVP